jgi:hypothetical protein
MDGMMGAEEGMDEMDRVDQDMVASRDTVDPNHMAAKTGTADLKEADTTIGTGQTGATGGMDDTADPRSLALQAGQGGLTVLLPVLGHNKPATDFRARLRRPRHRPSRLLPETWLCLRTRSSTRSEHDISVKRKTGRNRD